MDWDRIEGNWQQTGKLTDDQLDVIIARRKHLADETREASGISRGEVEEQATDWQSFRKEIRPSQ